MSSSERRLVSEPYRWSPTYWDWRDRAIRARLATRPGQPSAATMSGTACSIGSITLVSYSTHCV